jgi:hypothetical protein
MQRSSEKIGTTVMKRVLAACCVFVLCGILTAGLWPFTPFPKNDVSWLANENGVHFGDHGTILSSGTFRMTTASPEIACTLEIWLQPGLIEDTNTMLAFYSPENLVSFSMHQALSDLMLQRDLRDAHGRVSPVRVDVSYVFQEGKEVFITITSRAEATSVYLDGNLLMVSSHFGLSGKDLTGLLVVANSPVANDSWSGRLRGIAIFNRELTAAEILRHYDSWTKGGRPEIHENEEPRALYLFEERAGTVIHNHIPSAPDLYIPAHYMIVHPVLLERPWNEYYPGLGYYKNLLINIGGFIPLGFFLCTYLALARRVSRAVAVTIVIGAAVSLLIEVLQAYIPTRDSGMTDLITNTFGTGIGAMLCRSKLVQSLLARTRVLNG